MQTIDTAAREYANRPADEKFQTLQAYVDAATQDRQLSVERNYNLRDLEVTPTSDDRGESLILTSPKGQARFTHWSFGQMARMIGAPAGYLRELPPALAADCCNFGLHDAAHGTAANLLVRAPNGRPEPTVRSFTSESYGRVYDAQLGSEINRHFGDGASGGWMSPTSWGGDTFAGARGDRDSFILRVNGGSIVTDPSAAHNDSQMYRGILVRNSEVGAAAVVIETILFRYICGNFMLWGAVTDKSFRRRHVGTKALRDTMRELQDLAWRWTQRSASTDEAIIRSLIDNEIAHTKDAVIDELRSFGATLEQATEAYATCERAEKASPRSYWGVAQGLTRNSQQSPYSDERYELDKLAAVVLARGRKLVAA